MNKPDFEFFCYPVRAYSENPDGSPAGIEECELADAQWIGVYRRGPEPDDVNHVIGIDTGFNTVLSYKELVLKQAEGICDLLNAITPQEALYNPKLQVFFS